jgi:hypothetical protein
MALPAMIEGSWKEAVQIVGKKLFKVLAIHTGFWHGALQDTRFKIAGRRGHRRYAASLHRVSYSGESFVTNRTLQSMFGKQAMRLSFESALEVIAQSLLKL